MSPRPDRPGWLELFPDEEFRFHIGVKPGKPEEFFAPTADHARLLAERKHWLATAPGDCAVWLPEAAPLLEETLALAQQWVAPASAGSNPASSPDSLPPRQES
ncbi:MAG: hypothetical protein HZA89_02550 [Verrucomicrobia bacterium]|nr:hypothetical protein [Verrucomicrobiota bacterium]